MAVYLPLVVAPENGPHEQKKKRIDLPVPDEAVVAGADGRPERLYRQLDLLAVGQALLQPDEDVEHAVPDLPLAHVVRVGEALHLLEGGHQVEHLVLVGLLLSLKTDHQVENIHTLFGR